LSDSQWGATPVIRGQEGEERKEERWSSQTDVYGLEVEGRRFIQAEEMRSEKRMREDPRRNELGEWGIETGYMG
jgi:hypothetical protein